jgi:spermidine/putrescine transport system substrate-binding protein
VRSKILGWLGSALLLLLPVKAQSDFWSCPPGYAGDTLRIYNWTTYIAEDIISNFEALCGVSVSYNTFEDEAEMVAALEAGNNEGYDLVIPIDSTMYLLMGRNLLLPLNQANIPNIANIDASYLQRATGFDPENRFSVPYLWGTTGIGYHRGRVEAALGRPVTSWRDLFEAPPSVRVAWIDAERLMLGIALNMLGLDQSSSNPADVEAAADYLVSHAQNLAIIAQDDGQDRLAAGEVDMVIEYSGDVFQIISQFGDEYAYVVPVEGTVTDMTSLAIPVGAQNPALAEVFIDFLLDPQVSADIANFTVYGTPNRIAVEEGLIYEQYLDDPAIYPPTNVMDKLFLLVSSDEIDTLFTQVWEQVHQRTGQ